MIRPTILVRYQLVKFNTKFNGKMTKACPEVCSYSLHRIKHCTDLVESIFCCMKCEEYGTYEVQAQHQKSRDRALYTYNVKCQS